MMVRILNSGKVGAMVGNGRRQATARFRIKSNPCLEPTVEECIVKLHLKLLLCFKFWILNQIEHFLDATFKKCSPKLKQDYS